VGLRIEDIIVGETALKVASTKVVKHEKMYSDNQCDFIQFLFDTFDFLT
jgi:hypothetical protein